MTPKQIARFQRELLRLVRRFVRDLYAIERRASRGPCLRTDRGAVKLRRHG